MIETFAGCEVLAESDHMVIIDRGSTFGPSQIMRINKTTGEWDRCGRHSYRNEIISEMLDMEICHTNM